MIITAHRGASLLAPENTLAAIRKAIEIGADMAEIDVQLTSDGGLVVFHDLDLRRIAGIDRKIAHMTTSEIRTVDAGVWFSPEFKAERIPTLDEVLDLSRNRICLNIELKCDAPDPQLGQRVGEAMVAYSAVRYCVVSSQHRSNLAGFRSVVPDVPIGLILDWPVDVMEDPEFDFLSISLNLLDADFVTHARRRGMPVHVWTVNDRAQMQRCLDRGVAGIISDDPALLIEVVGEQSPRGNTTQIIDSFRRRSSPA